nr:hypothetical protein [Tanacetum cinerariifolium]
MKFVSKTQDYQHHGALIPDDMINQDIKDSEAYKTCYEFATRKVPPRKARKYKKVASPLRKLSLVKEAKPVKKGVSNEQQRKTSGTDEGTDTKPGVLDVPTYDSKSENESWSDTKNDNDDDSKGDDDKASSDDDEEHDKEHESDDDYENVFEEEDADLYEDVDIRSLGAEHVKERKENVPPAVDEVASMMNVKKCQEESNTQAPSLFSVRVTSITETATAHATTVLITISMITPPPQLTTSSPVPTTDPTTTSILGLPDFSSLFCFDQRISALE